MIAIEECGRFAREALAGGPGEVCAVFRRSLYLRGPGERYACLGDASLGRGPLNARIAGGCGLGRHAVGDALAVSISGATTWRPQLLRARRAAASLGANLASLERAATRQAARDGLGAVIVGAGSPLIEHARPAMVAIERWLAGEGSSIAPAAQGLIGLGPGLTPSGDDFLAGVMVGLHAQGNRACAARLWDWLELRAAQRTSAISRAHLAAAAQGEAHETLHDCVAALFATRAVRGAEPWSLLLARLDAVGHCSGRDGLAGVVAVARQRLR